MSKKLSLKKQLEAALRRIVELEAIIAQQAERIAELERQLGLNSKNSSKAPSSDGFKKEAIVRTQSLREETNRKVGGQAGHKGSTLKQVENPDVIKKHEVICCPDCKTDLTNEPVVQIIKRQVTDIPEIKPTIVEHQFDIKKCPSCKKKVETQSDNGIKAPVQYGNTIKSFITYLSVGQLIPQERIEKTMKDLFNLQISVATINSIIKLGAKLSLPSVVIINNELQKASLKNSDESGFTINGKIWWLQSLSNKYLVYYFVTEKRGDIPTNLKGIVVHDFFVSYFSKMKNVVHAICNAHILRELVAVKEIDKEDWAEPMIQLLLLCNKVKKKFEIITIEEIELFRKIYFRVVEIGLQYHEKLDPLKKPLRGKPKRRPGHNLLLRLKNFSEEILRFISNPIVPFTNNEAERDIRMIKLKQKISGGFRTLFGAQCFLTLKSYIETAKKNNVNIFHAITAAFEKKPLMFLQSC